jgi:hypothetical protein
MAKRSIVALALASVVLLIQAGVADATVLNGRGFRTQYPNGWAIARGTNRLGISYTLATPATSVNSAGIPTPGGIAMTINVFSKRRLDRVDRLPRSLRSVARRLASVPEGASGVRRGAARSGRRLNRAPTATIVLNYTYRGVPNTQRDLVSRRGDRIVVIEVNTTPNVASRGNAALNQVVGAWRWR